MRRFWGIVTFVAALNGYAVPVFESGDRVAFVGDSITHAGSYHPDIYLFYATRFPLAPFKVYNCGISGDTAPGTNRRFEKDIAVRKPNKATVMLGMNDAWAWLFDPDEPLERRQKELENAYKIYTKEMDQLAARLKGIGCEIIFIKPSIYDQTAVLEKQNLVGKNDLLGRFADYIDVMAEPHGGMVVDFRTPMMEINERLQGEDFSATVVGPDRVHPGAPGHFIMMYTFLKAQGMPRLVSSISIEVPHGKILNQVHCTIQDVKIASDRVSFRCKEDALPFPITANLKTALQWVPFQEELNQQLFQVTHLEAGRYELKIDDCSVGTWSAEELAQGINLSDNPRTPQVEQALKVKAVNDQRRQVVGKLRAMMLVRHTIINKLDPAVDEKNLDQLVPALKAHMKKYEGEPWSGYLNSQIEKYIEYAPQEQALSTEAEVLMEKMWTVNQPSSHRWELVKQRTNEADSDHSSGSVK
jgi:lysophospholipase L1-like esterase